MIEPAIHATLVGIIVLPFMSCGIAINLDKPVNKLIAYNFSPVQKSKYGISPPLSTPVYPYVILELRL